MTKKIQKLHNIYSFKEKAEAINYIQSEKYDSRIDNNTNNL